MPFQPAVSASPETTAAPSQAPSSGLIDLSTQTVSPHDRVEFWREMVCRQFADVQLTSRLGTDFYGELHGRAWDNAALSIVKAKAESARRIRREARDVHEDCYFAVLLLSGTELVEQDDRRAALGPGDITIYDAQSPHRVIFPEDFQKVIMQIPRPMLQDRIGGIGNSTALTIPRSHHAAAMAGTFLQSFARQMRELSEPELATYTELSLDLLSIAVASVSRVEVRRSRDPGQSLYRVKAYIEQHLADNRLDAAMIAHGTGLSVRYINQLLEREHTSLMRHVWTRRLERCRGEILACGSAGLRLYDIALRWGFSTPSHFSRAFKQQFGCTPRDYWQAHRVSQANLPASG